MGGRRGAGLLSSVLGLPAATLSAAALVGPSGGGRYSSAVVSTASAAVGVARAVARAGTRVAVGPLARQVHSAAGLVAGRDERLLWSAGGRAQVRVRGLAGDASGKVAIAVEEALSALDGVGWARVDAVTGCAAVRFDPTRLEPGDLVAAVAAAEEAAGAGAAPGGREDDVSGSLGVEQRAWALAADLAGLCAAVTGRALRLPALPGAVAAAGVLVDYQPRLRRLVEDRIGVEAAELVLAAANATALGLTRGAPSLAVDAALRAQALLAARSRRSALAARHDELWDDDRPVRREPPACGGRPVPLPSGPVERYTDKAATGSLLAAGALLVGTGSPGAAARALLVGAPKPARAARDAFAEELTRGLCARGCVVSDAAALRRMDRVDTVVLDAAVLHGNRPLVVSARPLADHWTLEHVWSAAQRLLLAEHHLPIPPPRGRQRQRLALSPADASTGESRRVLTEDGAPVGEVTVGTELDPYADAVLAAARATGARLLVTPDAMAPELSGRVDAVVDSTLPLHRFIRRLEGEGRVVAVVSADEDALAAADLGVGVVPATGRVPWAADVLLGPGLHDVPRLLAAIPRARAVSARGVSSAAGASFLGALLALGGRRRPASAVLPVTLATGGALITGALSARRVCGQPAPRPVLHVPWHALEPDEVLLRLAEAPPTAVTDGEDAPQAAGAPDVGGGGGLRALARSVAAELADPLTPVLATGAAASAAIGSATDALLVGGVLAGNALVSGFQRVRADRALQALLLDQRIVARLVPAADGSAVDGPPTEVAASALRPGDVIELRPGDVVPADARLLRVTGLEVDEATLTGESVAIGKQLAATPGAELADRACMVYEGTTVLAGSGRAVVVAVGTATEAGRALALAAGATGPAGMQARLEELTRRGLPVTLLGGAAVTALALLRGQPLPRALASGVSVAVAAVPEGLPLVATVAQLGAARRLSARGVLVRSARTVEALGRVDTVCFDKTGTLTEGRLRLVAMAGPERRWSPEAPEGQRVLRAAARACPLPEDGRPAPHATDRAILEAAERVLGDEHRAGWAELTELPFQSDRGFSAAVGRTGRNWRLVVKGAPEVLLPRCTHLRDDRGKRRLDGAGRDRAQRAVDELAGERLRVLAVARRNVSDVVADLYPGVAAPQPEELTEDLTLLGFVALADTPRPRAAPTVTALHRAGLSTVMITGDHPVTARAVAASLGIPVGRVVTGPELAGLDEQAHTAAVGAASVFARVSPEQKLRIVAALRRAGRVVAMTGDGANDAAAIRLADVGIGMAAHGSTSARTAADLVLTEPDVALLLDALVEGRAMWRRVRDAVAVLLGGNAGEVGFTLAGTALGGRAPIGTRQFLLVNMLTDLLPAMAIALAPTPPGQPERAALLAGGVPSLGRPLRRDIAMRGAATGAGALVAWQIGRLTGTRRRASTIALAALVATQLGQTLAVGGRNPVVLATGLGSTALLAALVQTPGVSQFFGCTPLDPLAWLTVAGCATASALLAAAARRRFATSDGRGAEPAVPQEQEEESR